MKTTLKTQTYQITITEISPDFDNDTRLEICFETELTRDYLATLPCADDILADLELDETGLTFELNVAQRHDDKLYMIIKNDRSGDCCDDLAETIIAFGQPIIAFIADSCRLLNIPFYPND